MAASSFSQNVELEAAKFLQKHIQESKDEPANLATKLSVILQLMKTSGKEHSMPYQVTSRAMETLINQHGLDIEASKSSHAPLSGPQVGDSSTLRQSDSLPAVEVGVNTTSEQEIPISNHPSASGKAAVGPSSGHEYYQGSGSLGNRSNQSFDQESPSSVDTRSANSQSQERRDASNYSRKTEPKRKRRDPSQVSEPHMENPQKGEPCNTRKGKMNKVDTVGSAGRVVEQTNFNIVQSAGPVDHLPSSLLTRIKQEDQMQSVASYDGRTLVSMPEQRSMNPYGVSSTPFEHSMNRSAGPSNRGDDASESSTEHDRGRLSMTTNSDENAPGLQQPSSNYGMHSSRPRQPSEYYGIHSAVQEAAHRYDMHPGLQQPSGYYVTHPASVQREVEQHIEDVHVAPGAPATVRNIRDARGRFARSTQADTTGSSEDVNEGDDSWILSGPAPGGPAVVEIIPSFGGHVALDIWLGRPEREKLRSHTRVTFLEKFQTNLWPVPAGSHLADALFASGLSHLPHSLPVASLDIPLLTAFIERWQPDTNSFHMPWGEMTIMLHDVEQILMLRTEGTVCSANGGWETAGNELLAEWGGLAAMKMPYGHNKPDIFMSQGLHMESLCRIFRSCTDLEKQVQAYLLLVICSTVFVDRTSDRCHVRYLPLLSDRDSIGQVAWGAGTLAYLYRTLGIATRAKGKGVGGCLPLLQCWIYEYFPDLAPCQPPTPQRDGAPRVPRSEWWKTNAGRKRSSLPAIRAQLDNMSVNRVTWTPYGLNQHKRFRMTLFNGVIRCMEVTEPYHPWRCLRQLGYIQNIPSSLPFRPDEVYRGRDPAKYKVKFAGRLCDQIWHSFDKDLLVIPEGHPLAFPPDQTVSDYMSWYIERSHRFIIPCSTGSEFAPHHREHLPSHLGHAQLETLWALMRRQPDRDEFIEQVSDYFRKYGPDMAKWHGVDTPPWPPASWDDYQYQDEDETD